MALILTLVVVVTGPCRGDDAVLSRGRVVYRERCAICHGIDGRGDGEGVYLLLAPPRDLHAGRFRFVSTWEHVATDEDLFETITRGLPGSQMPSFERLAEPDRRALVAAVKAFADEPWVVRESRPPGTDGTPGQGVVLVPPEPVGAASHRDRAQELFLDACAPCHGREGRGDGRTDLVDVDGHPIRPRNFTLGAFKGDPAPEALYRRIIVGVPGTPMPSNEWAYGEDAWFLVRYVLALHVP
jgi:mono/diheme cytochrome c family protein